jgi:hypothetical protein
MPRPVRPPARLWRLLPLASALLLSGCIVFTCRV